jgi:type I restriction enzyme, S subunit
MSSFPNSTRVSSGMSTETQIRTYKRAESAVFSKTKEGFGGLSNMAAGFPLQVNGAYIRTSEALYQACRFPHLPDVQRLIIVEASPMTAKMKSKPYRKDSRPDWDRVRVKIMRWCLRVKLAQNWSDFSRLLLSTGDRPIVEESRKDDFWGAKVVSGDTHTLVGTNALGRLLMEIREQVKHSNSDQLRRVEPLPLADFLLFGKPIAVVEAQPPKLSASSVTGDPTATRPPYQPRPSTVVPGTERPMLFDRSASQARGNTLVDALRPYPEYKESGLPWLGQIPRFWEVKRAKSIFQRIDKRSTTGKEELLTVSSARGIVPRKTANVTMFKAESYLGYKLCWPGDLVINSLWAWAGGLGVSKYHGIISSAYGVYRIRPSAPMIPAFVHEVVRSSSFNWELRVRSKGVWISRLQLTDISFLDAPMHIPPPAEQAAIVRFLDWANGRLEPAIRAKRKVIALLIEQKQAIIHRAVTRGLDPSVPLKPSGMPWLGESPAHWKWIPIKRLLSRMDYGTSQASTETGTIRLLTMGNIQKGEVIMPRSGGLDNVQDLLLLEHHDLLFTRTNGNPELVGKVGIFRGQRPDRVSFASYLVRLRVKSPHEPQWLHMLLNSSAFWPFARSHALVNLQTNLNSTRYGQFPIPVPPPAEQALIANWVVEKSKPLNSAVSRLEREIALLREYRTRLVADVVTGKLDVREAAARLPEEAVPDIAENDTDLSHEIEPADEEAAV